MLHKSRRNKILYEQTIAERFHHYQAYLTRAAERSTKHRKEQPVPATQKMQTGKVHRYNEETASINRENSQLASKLQDQIHT